MTAWLAAGCLAASAVSLGAGRLRRRRSGLREAVARAGHEIRGPLCAARLGLELVGRSASPPARQLRALGLELDRVELALCDLERACGGADGGCRRPAEPALRPVALNELVRDCVSAWRPAAQARGVALDARWSGRPATVLADRVRLAQGLENLIANALEHGGGPVQVRGCSLGSAVRLEVTDAGPGLPAPLPDLVRRSPRWRPRQRRRAGRGRGRGLGIALAAARAHGGELTTAPSRCGARLVLWLPLGGAEMPARAGGPRG